MLERQVFMHVILPETRIYNGKPFPLCIAPPPNRADLKTSPAAVISYLKTHSDHVLALLRSHSVVLFRDFASSVSTPEMFATVITSSLALKKLPYSLGNAVRTPVVGDLVFTANESPPEKPIPFHHELAQTPMYPSKILFYCEKPANTGGETPVLLSEAVYNDLSKAYPDFLYKLERHGVIYSRVMSPHDRPHSAIGRGWHGTFGARNRKEAEKKLMQRGYKWEWLGDGEEANLREMSPALPAVVSSNGRKAFFNQIYAVWGGWRDEFNKPQQSVRAGDGSSLSEDCMRGLARIMKKHEVAIPWKRGDFMLIDNMMAMHSRKTFTGKRRVLASLVK